MSHQTPFELASQLANKQGVGKCKTWKRGFRDGWLGIKGELSMSYDQYRAYADGWQSGQAHYAAPSSESYAKLGITVDADSKPPRAHPTPSIPSVSVLTPSEESLRSYMRRQGWISANESLITLAEVEANPPHGGTGASRPHDCWTCGRSYNRLFTCRTCSRNTVRTAEPCGDHWVAPDDDRLREEYQFDAHGHRMP